MGICNNKVKTDFKKPPKPLLLSLLRWCNATHIFILVDMSEHYSQIVEACSLGMFL